MFFWTECIRSKAENCNGSVSQSSTEEGSLCQHTGSEGTASGPAIQHAQAWGKIHRKPRQPPKVCEGLWEFTTSLRATIRTLLPGKSQGFWQILLLIEVLLRTAHLRLSTGTFSPHLHYCSVSDAVNCVTEHVIFTPDPVLFAQIRSICFKNYLPAIKGLKINWEGWKKSFLGKFSKWTENHS